jgi:hypothetical protein
VFQTERFVSSQCLQHCWGKILLRSIFLKRSTTVYIHLAYAFCSNIEKQTSKGGIQVVTTTHSPDLLAMIRDETFKNTSVVARLPGTSESIARPVADIPKASDLRKSQGLGRLHASGWLEDALAFAAASTDDREEG